MARPTERLFRLVLEPHAGRASCRFRREARARERHRHRPVDSLKALDPKRPIREADMCSAIADVRFGPIADVTLPDCEAHLAPTLVGDAWRTPSQPTILASPATRQHAGPKQIS